MTPKLLSLDDLRTAHEDIERRKEARTAQYDADKAAAEASLMADMEKMDAEAAELEVAQRVWQRLATEAQQAKPTPNGHDRPAEPDPENEAEAEDQAAAAPAAAGTYRTHKDMVAEAVRTIGARTGVWRHEIEQWIKHKYKVEVPPPSISTYLKRLKNDGLVDNPGDGLCWRPAGGLGL